MTIPANLTHAEVGAFLVAVGQHMIENGVCAGAVLEPQGMDDERAYIEHLAREMSMADFYGDLTIERSLEIMEHLTLAEAIEFVRLPDGLEP